MTAFLGMELATVHVKEVSNPQKTFPRSLAFSTLIILSTMILGSLAIAFVLPYNQINLVNGTIQTFSYFLAAYHLSWLIPILTILLIIGSIGGITSWVISPSKSLLQAAHHGFLPAYLKQENKHGIAQNLLLTQAVLVSLVCLAFLCIPSINGSYWLLTALSTQLYMFMYVLMFVSALLLRNKIHYQKNAFVIPGKKLGLSLVCLLGLLGCAITIIVGFLPPDGIDVGNKLVYKLLFSGGLIVMITPVLFFYWFQKRSSQITCAMDDTIPLLSS